MHYGTNSAAEMFQNTLQQLLHGMPSYVATEQT